jgi:hypothetical protein
MARGEEVMPTPYGTISTSEGPVTPEPQQEEPKQDDK